MPRSIPLPDWQGEDAYVIGGGSSLREFDWSWLFGRNTIGCNQAFMLGADAINICAFGDIKFWSKFQRDLEKFEGWVVTNFGVPRAPAWLKIYKRQQHGLFKDSLGWNWNTGAMAVNLALILGASRIFLLGMDMKAREDGKTHWHDVVIDRSTPQHYDRFMTGFETVKRQLPVVFPGRQVFNVSDGTSRLVTFPVVELQAMKEMVC